MVLDGVADERQSLYEVVKQVVVNFAVALAGYWALV